MPSDIDPRDVLSSGLPDAPDASLEANEKEADGANPGVAAQDEKKFWMQEFVELRQEIILNTEEKRRLERFCLVAAAIIFAWIATEAPKSGPDSNLYLAAVIPTILVGFGWLKSAALEATISKLGSYIYEIEEKLSPQGGGWEHHYSEKKNDGGLSPEGISKAFWPVLLIVSIIGGLVLALDTNLGALVKEWLFS